MTSPIKLAYMFIVAFSAVMIGVAMVHLEGFIAGGFIGLWFAVMMFSGGQFLLVGRQSQDSDQVQRDYQETLTRTRPVRRRRRRDF